MSDAFLGSSLIALPNGNPITCDILSRAHAGDVVCMTILWRGAVAFFKGTVYTSMSRICFERDIRQKKWFTSTVSISKRYASLLVRDWVLYGDGSERMLYDMAHDYTRHIVETALLLGEYPPFDNKLVRCCGHILPQGITQDTDRLMVIRS